MTLSQEYAREQVDLLSPSGPFFFASDEELEAIEAEQAGVIRG